MYSRWTRKLYKKINKQKPNAVYTENRWPCIFALNSCFCTSLTFYLVYFFSSSEHNDNVSRVRFVSYFFFFEINNSYVWKRERGREWEKERERESVRERGRERKRKANKKFNKQWQEEVSVLCTAAKTVDKKLQSWAWKCVVLY